MEYEMRRFRQELDRDEIERILREGTSGVLALCDADGMPYAVPLSYAWVGDTIYFHSALTGHKIADIRQNPKASFCVIARDDVHPAEFVTYYQSVIAFGRIEIVDDPAGKTAGLKHLSDKYCPGIDPTAEISRFIDNVLILKFHIESLTGKQAKPLAN